ncbi:sigma-70 family RNA polymerase sigma factor [Nocardioides dongkuii]|uniref:sigma-70 family RNA polymerase sigma factor n=1 Tax=Nocardioides dongkuii TaxID=2760089 RepID=UPI0015FAF133|nr:sigma-70 family RNA polymerase sigma factor [Nocardioides dongkuii]
MGSESDVRGLPALTDSLRRAETTRLLARAHASRGASRSRYENEVVGLNMVVAAEVARRYHGRGISGDDLDQVAFLGLVKAVRRFDPTRGEEFLAFAVPTVRGEVRRYFRDAGWAVRPPRSVQDAQRRIRDAESDLAQRLGRDPRPPEVAGHLGVPLSLVLDAQGAAGCFFPTSLDAPAGSGDSGDLASPAEWMGDLDPAYAVAEARLAVQPLLRDLDARDRTIIELRYFENRTQAEIGAAVGVSQVQVSRLIAQILRRLRARLAVA